MYVLYYNKGFKGILQYYLTANTELHYNQSHWLQDHQRPISLFHACGNDVIACRLHKGPQPVPSVSSFMIELDYYYSLFIYLFCTYNIPKVSKYFF